VAGVVYRFTTVIEIGDTGAEAPISEITFAILDSSFEEISTKVYNYSTPGFKVESFDLSPDAAGFYFAVRVRNDTPTETKNYFVRYALGGNGEQLLENSDFDDGSVWTNEDSGTDWVITGGAATLTLPSGDSKELTQIISGSQPGGYQLISRRTASNITPVTDSLNLGYLFYDTDDNLISSTVDFVTADGEQAISHAFTALVPITRIVVVASINSGADIDIVIPYVYLFGPTDASVTVPESQVIRVEQVDEFYDPVPVVNISNIRSVSRKYDT
jgi:hypothetical protein